MKMAEDLCCLLTVKASPFAAPWLRPLSCLVKVSDQVTGEQVSLTSSLLSISSAVVYFYSYRHIRGSHWLNTETGRHKKVDRSARICPMCVGRITNPDIPADCFDAFDSDEDAPVPRG